MKTQERTIENLAVLIADSHHGIYIPKLVVSSNLNYPNWDFSEVDKEDINDVLSGPENENYWDAWNNIESNVKIFDDEGIEYFLVSNDDLWAIPCDLADQLEDWII